MSELPATFVPGFHNEDTVREMDYVDLGNGLVVSKLSLGGAAFAPFYGHDNESEAIRTIHESIRCGINYIDTAPYYGQGRSEEVIGKALQNIPRVAYYIATKVGRYEIGASGFDFSAARTEKELEISLKRLQLDYIDVIQIHDIEFADNVDIIVNETLPVLEKAKREGKVRFIGVSGYPLVPLKEAISKAPGRIDCVLTYCRYTMLDNSLLEHLPFFANRGIGVICAAATAMGILTNRGELDWHVASDEIKQRGRACAEYCKQRNVELGKLAVWYTAQLRCPATFLVGMPTAEILAQNLDVFKNGLTQLEKEALNHCLELLGSDTSSNWEGVEIKQLFNR